VSKSDQRIARFCIFRITSRRISRIMLVEGILKMKTFIVYDLDSQLPIAVGEQVSAETALCCASMATGIFHANLFAEEIDLKLPAEPQSGRLL
jgi:hypothetical protein